MRTVHLTSLALSLAAAAVLSAGQPRVAIVAAAAGSPGDSSFTDPRDKLLATGEFSAVDIIPVTAAGSTPTLDQLLAYDAVLVWSNVNFNNAVLLGDRLADYTDQGGGVVVATFANTSINTSRYLRGRFDTDNYHLIPPALGSSTGRATLGTIGVPGHPIMDGVNTLDGGTSSFRPTTLNLTDHAVLVARWSDGRTLVAVSSRFPSRVDLGLYPPSSDSSSMFWVASTDGARLMANALLYATSASPSCAADFNNDGFLDFFDLDAFVACFEGEGCPSGRSPDFNNDGFVDFFDADAFFEAFEAGC
ncbi:MAG: PEP-CTERM sorting domain-containing protein [Phycisphaeraceae bacterium]|nr:MAG: PEP-CTERM sorting domain-containing protein [Phycisphaeraceae bacterium]